MFKKNGYATASVAAPLLLLLLDFQADEFLCGPGAS